MILGSDEGEVEVSPCRTTELGPVEKAKKWLK